MPGGHGHYRAAGHVEYGALRRARSRRASRSFMHKHCSSIRAVALVASPHRPRLCSCSCLSLAVAGMIYENISEARDRRFNPMTGRRFDVGGYRMHMDCTGEGSPTVILESGLGDTYVSWRKVQPQIAKFTRVCSYDRAGLGYSDSSPQPRTSKVIAGELHALLQGCGSCAALRSRRPFDGWIQRAALRQPISAARSQAWCWSMRPILTRRIVFRPSSRIWKAAGVREAEFLEYTMPFGIPRLHRSVRRGSRATRCRVQFSYRARRRGGAEELSGKRCPDGCHRFARRPAAGRALARSR